MRGHPDTSTDMDSHRERKREGQRHKTFVEKTPTPNLSGPYQPFSSVTLFSIVCSLPTHWQAGQITSGYKWWKPAMTTAICLSRSFILPVLLDLRWCGVCSWCARRGHRELGFGLLPAKRERFNFNHQSPTFTGMDSETQHTHTHTHHTHTHTHTHTCALVHTHIRTETEACRERRMRKQMHSEQTHMHARCILCMPERRRRAPGPCLLASSKIRANGYLLYICSPVKGRGIEPN
jgi:hypothetical protein